MPENEKPPAMRVDIYCCCKGSCGGQVDLLIEGHGRFNIPTGIKIAKELEQFKPMFFEEPVPPDNLDALKAVKDKSPVAISAGERLYTRWDYRPMFDKMAADYIQLDISHAGGIMELKKIAAEAESRYIPFAPHNPSGPVANAATLQLAATCPNFEILEIMYSDVDWRKDSFCKFQHSIQGNSKQNCIFCLQRRTAWNDARNGIRFG